MTYSVDKSELDYVEGIARESKLLLQELDGLKDFLRYRRTSPAYSLIDYKLIELLEQTYARSRIMTDVTNHVITERRNQTSS